MRIYNLPYQQRRDLCRLLDLHDKWEELGGMYMGIDVLTLQYFRKKPSPTDELLTHWGMRNHTVLELFVLLSRMQNYQAMTVLEPCVDPKYHRLIYEGEENLSVLLANRMTQNNAGSSNSQRQNHIPTAPLLSGKDLGLGPNNLNVNNTTGPVVHMKNPLAGVMDEVKTINTPVQNRETNGTASTVRPGNNATPLEAHLSTSVVNNVSPKAPGPVSPVSPQQRKLSNVSTASSNAESCTPLISYSELEAATNGWDRSCILGRGGFGTVYKGTWKNTLVAIKKLETQRDNISPQESVDLLEVQRQQSLRELKYLNSFRHDNILPLYGYSVGGEASCLVYQFMVNGSLEDRLMCRQGTKPLTWIQRHKIATGTARGLQFLHSVGDKPLVHGDIKSANILLDPHFEPRIGDFGLAREGPLEQYTHVKVSRVHGTRPYLPDEFLRNKKFSTKVDTFSFGIVLFELATGQRAYEDSREKKFLKEHVEKFSDTDSSKLADPKAGPDECMTALGLLALGHCCVANRRKDRPDMVKVLEKLDTMAETREKAKRAQCLLKQNSLNPTTPYEIQLIHDHLSEQRKLIPPSHNGTQKLSQYVNHTPIVIRSKLSPADPMPLYISPQGHIVPPQKQELLCFGTPEQGISPDSQKPLPLNIPLHNGFNNRVPFEQGSNHQPWIRHISPEQTGYPHPLDIYHPPVQTLQINVSPPSRPNFSELLPSPQPAPTETNMPVVLEDVLSVNTDHYSYIESPLTPCDDLPLMTELGIKPHETLQSIPGIAAEALSSS